MSTPSCNTGRRSALAVILLLTFSVPLLLTTAVAQSSASPNTLTGPTTIRRDVHHDTSLPLSEMIKHAQPPSLERREVEPLKMTSAISPPRRLLALCSPRQGAIRRPSPPCSGSRALRWPSTTPGTPIAGTLLTQR